MKQSELRPRKTISGSLDDLVAQYKAAPEFRTQINQKTQKDYARYLDILKPYGDLPASEMSRRFILEERDRLSDRPRTANYFVQVVRRLYSFEVDRGIVSENPARRSKMLKTGGKYNAWSDEDCSKFENSHPPNAMLRAYMLGHYTGQRQSDILNMTITQDKGSSIDVMQSKTGKALRIPVHQRLRSFLDEQIFDALLMLSTQTGRPYKSDFFAISFAGRWIMPI